MKISETIWRAANEHLWPGLPYKQGRLVTHSCTAIVDAELGEDAPLCMPWRTACRKSAAVQFLHGLGCPTNGLCAFDRFEPGEARQGARYLWLMFAYEVAKSEGL